MHDDGYTRGFILRTMAGPLRDYLAQTYCRAASPPASVPSKEGFSALELFAHELVAGYQ